MTFNEKLADRIRESLMDVPNLEEKIMFGGLCFMVNEKICLGVFKDEMLCRIDPVLDSEVVELTGCRPMDSSGKSMKGFVFISEGAMKMRKEFEYWIGLCLEFNPRAKASKKKQKPQI
jgi:hypothetical protein